MRWLSQIGAITVMVLRTIPERLGASITAAIGIAGVVAVMVTMLSIKEGFKKTMQSTGSPETAFVMRSGNDSELSSTLAFDDARIVSDAPGVLRRDGVPVVSAELFVIVDIPRKVSGTAANVPLRGVQPGAFDVRDNIRIVDGRRFEAGRNEIIAGIGASREFEGLAVGNRFRWGQNEWEVVGLFAADGSLSESELWCDVRVLQPAYRRGNTFQSVRARLESPRAFEEFKDALTTDPRLRVRVMREDEYFASQSQVLDTIINVLGGVVVILMSLGALFGAVLTMYSAVASRTREIATLRALGFGGGPVVVSVLAEAVLLALAGGLLGGIAAYLSFNGYRAATLSFQSFSQVVFNFRVTPALLIQGLVLSVVVGLIGSVLPAIRAARMSVAAALREL